MEFFFIRVQRKREADLWNGNLCVSAVLVMGENGGKARRRRSVKGETGRCVNAKG